MRNSLLFVLTLLQGLDSRKNPFQEGEDNNGMDHIKALKELDEHKIKTYNVWKVHQSE